MKEYRRLSHKIGCAAGVLALLCWLSGCSPMPPDRASGDSSLPTPQAEIIGSAEAGLSITTAPTEQPRVVAVTGTPTAVGDRAHGSIRRVDTYVDATQAMMGFVDTPAVSLYSRFLDILTTSLSRSFPDAAYHTYRADIDHPDNADALVEGSLSQEATSPSFYLVRRLTHLPERVQLAEGSLPQSNLRMNTFTNSYYEQKGLTLPADVRETDAPITWAVGQSAASSDAVTLFLTDLHELQLHTGALAQALREHAFVGGSTVGILALPSEFSGLVPLDAAEPLWYQWGALPSGAMDKLLDYGYYTLGITQDAAEREEAERPFYLLCVGRSDVVSDFLAMAKHQLGVSLSAEPPESQSLVYRLDYASPDPNLSKNTRLTGYSQSGVNVSASELAQTGHSYVQLQKANAGDSRFVEFTIPYASGANDPRTGAFTAKDFALSTQVTALAPDGSLGEEVAPPGPGLPVQLSIGQNDAERVEVIARLTFPQGVLPKGDYQVGLSLTIQPPPAQVTPGWALALSSDLSAQQRAGSFDGSKTVGLEGFLSALSGLQEEQLAPMALGDFTFPLYVVVDER